MMEFDEAGGESEEDDDDEDPDEYQGDDEKEKLVEVIHTHDPDGNELKANQYRWENYPDALQKSKGYKFIRQKFPIV